MPRVHPDTRVARRKPSAGLLISTALLTSCAAGGTDSATEAETEAETETETETEQAPLSACSEPSGQVNDPRSVMDVVDIVNAMPKPATLPCFMESLARPLSLHASRSIFSAQPASGTRSPRMFLFSDPLIMTVVPEGSGGHLLEMGELRSPTRSLKAEIEFPVTRELLPHEPFESLMFDDTLTNCAFCHAAEEPDASIDFARAFVSQALKPQPESRVSIESLRQEFQQCDPVLEPERCAFFDAVFAWGEVLERDFPEAMETFP